MTIAALFVRQAEACERLGSPFMNRLLRLCAERLTRGNPVADRLILWPGDATAHGDAIALRFAGALHALVLMGRDQALTAAYPPNNADDETLWHAIEQAMTTHQDHLQHWLDSAPQTNEVRRSSALIYASHLLAHRFPGLAFRISELGASAGLNLYFDHFGLALPDGTRRGPNLPVLTLSPDWTGPFPANSKITIADRRGVDLNPLDPTNPGDVLRLRSYTWPDQPDRMERLALALSIADPVVDRGDAGDWLENRLTTRSEGQIDLIYHTIAWQYFPPETDSKCRAALASAGERATMQNPLAHLAVEIEDEEPGAIMRLNLWSGASAQPEIIDLGRIDPHGRRIQTQTGG